MVLWDRSCRSCWKYVKWVGNVKNYRRSENACGKHVIYRKHQVKCMCCLYVYISNGLRRLPPAPMGWWVVSEVHQMNATNRTMFLCCLYFHVWFSCLLMFYICGLVPFVAFILGPVWNPKTSIWETLGDQSGALGVHFFDTGLQYPNSSQGTSLRPDVFCY